MSGKITKKKAAEFNKKFIEKILELGALPIVNRMDFMTSFELKTIVGRLVINLYNEHNYCYTVFSRFDDVDKAKLKFDCNSYSGKYNIHASGSSNTVDEAVKEAIQHFECTLK